ncbi:hypothetical protein [Serratia marcescens]|uniref:Uncharacterized protein n=1 Tax=Serratia marcescens TaxID=615 RepID=A0A379YVM5_SERMA|nr:hypothetical protein [Serratia marcescens]KFD14368.1 hypothetical protein GSMA_02177 [Serratia marcescens subsp. marcescens ATCC 13880]KFL01560.1 hypothetical protein DP21_1861 [Serratia marcescens]MBN5250135.1 hypothetical protein [Serratia marcescens]MBN5259420.1 hypothetical protein [Serratia marcescens]MBN5354946.1 hypothetical protein [Serratia marcescens]
MTIDTNYIKDIVIPTLTLLSPVFISVVKWWYSRGSKNYDSRRNNQFDRVSDVKRQSVLSRIQGLRDGPQNGMVPLRTKALYESIGIRLPVWVAHQLVDYLGRAPVALSDLALNCFLRRTSLTSNKNDVFSLDGCRLLHQRVSLFVFLIISALAITWGFYITVFPLSESGGSATDNSPLWGVFFFFAYLLMAIFVVAWSINEWESLRHAEAFWLKWQPHLYQNEAEYQAHCQHARNVAAQENVPDIALETVDDLSPAEKPLRGWLMRRLGKKNN